MTVASGTKGLESSHDLPAHPGPALSAGTTQETPPSAPRVPLPARPAQQLPINPRALVHLRRDHVQTAPLAHALPLYHGVLQGRLCVR
jgi:hypothetical protein